MQMDLTQDFKQTVQERVQRDPAFAAALLDEAVALPLDGESESVRLMLREMAVDTGLKGRDGMSSGQAIP